LEEEKNWWGPFHHWQIRFQLYAAFFVIANKVKQSNLIKKLDSIRLPPHYAPRNDWMRKLPINVIYQLLEEH